MEEYRGIENLAVGSFDFVYEEILGYWFSAYFMQSIVFIAFGKALLLLKTITNELQIQLFPPLFCVFIDTSHTSSGSHFILSVESFVEFGCHHDLSGTIHHLHEFLR